jgi:hypothetical protein
VRLLGVPSIDAACRTRSTQVLYAMRGDIKLGILPLLFFQNGHSYFTQKLHERRNIVPYVVHATYQYGDGAIFPFGKRQRMREAGLWLVRPRVPPCLSRLTAMQKLRIVMLGFGAGRQKMALERGTNPKLSRRTCTCEYGLQSCRGKSAGVAKWRRERSPTPNIPTVTIRDCFIAVCRRPSLSGACCRWTGLSTPRATTWRCRGRELRGPSTE